MLVLHVGPVSIPALSKGNWCFTLDRTKVNRKKCSLAISELDLGNKVLQCNTGTSLGPKYASLGRFRVFFILELAIFAVDNFYCSKAVNNCLDNVRSECETLPPISVILKHCTTNLDHCWQCSIVLLGSFAD